MCALIQGSFLKCSPLQHLLASLPLPACTCMLSYASLCLAEETLAAHTYAIGTSIAFACGSTFCLGRHTTPDLHCTCLKWVISDCCGLQCGCVYRQERACNCGAAWEGEGLQPSCRSSSQPICCTVWTASPERAYLGIEGAGGVAAAQGDAEALVGKPTWVNPVTGSPQNIYGRLHAVLRHFQAFSAALCSMFVSHQQAHRGSLEICAEASCLFVGWCESSAADRKMLFDNCLSCVGWRQCVLLSSAAAAPLPTRSRPYSGRPRCWQHSSRLPNLLQPPEAKVPGAEAEGLLPAGLQQSTDQSPLSQHTPHQHLPSRLKVHSVDLT